MFIHLSILALSLLAKNWFDLRINVAQTAPLTQTAQVTGLYLTDYDRVVKPQQRFLIPNYFIEYWVSRLGPSFAWVVVSLQQACWRANADSCVISQAVLADEIGLERRSVSRILKTNKMRQWYIPTIAQQKGRVRDKTYQPLPHKYTIYLSTPLIPEHLSGLWAYCHPHQTADAMEAAIEQLLSMKSRAALALLEKAHTAEPHAFSEPIPLIDLVGQASGLSITPDSNLARQLSRLQTHLTEIGHTNCRQYFRQQWLPHLGPTLAWLVMALRSACYYNPQTDEVRDSCTWRKKALADLLGQSTRNLSNLLKQPEVAPFFQITDQQKYQLTFQVNLVEEPLLASIAIVTETESAQHRKKYDITTPDDAKKCDTTPITDAKKCDITSANTGKNVTSPPDDAKKCDTFKYLKESIPFVVDNKDKDLYDLLTTANLAGAGLRQLCDRDPPLDVVYVRGVILYAQVNDLGPGYLYRHLMDGLPLDAVYTQLVTLPAEQAERFAGLLVYLQAGQPPTTADLPPEQVSLFAQYAQIHGGYDPAEIETLLRIVQSGGNNQNRAKAEADNDPVADLWAETLVALRYATTQQVYEQHLANTELIIENGQYTIVSPNPHSRAWLQHRLRHLIDQKLSAQVGQGVEVVIGG